MSKILPQKLDATCEGHKECITVVQQAQTCIIV